MRTISWRLWALIALSSALQVLMFPIAGPVPLWRSALGWIAIIPLLVAVLAANDAQPLRVRHAALLGYVCGVLWYMGNCYWIYQTMYLYGGLPKPVSVCILVLFSLYLGLYHALFAVVLAWLRQGRTGLWSALLLSPFAWVAVELARARITGFPWDLLGYTQVDNGALTMLAPLGGVMLLSFLIAAVNAVLATAWFAPRSGRRVIYAAAGLLLAIAGQLGTLYHSAPDDPGSQHYATLLQENLLVGAPGQAVESLSMEEKYRQFGALTRDPQFLMETGEPTQHWMEIPGSPPPDFILWPEAPADFATSDDVFRQELSALARTQKAPVIAGALGVDFDPHAEGGYREYGSAAVFAPDGTYMGRYDKIHRVPWGEYVPYKKLFFFAGSLISGVGNMSPGTEHTVFHFNGHSFSVFICYESIFGDEVREFVKDGAQVLINISDDGWYGDTGAPWQHLNMARMRAIENRRWLLRDTNTGVTTAIDPHGRGVFSTPRHVRAAYGFDFGYRTGTTFYTAHGEWFAWICAALTLLAVVLARKTVQSKSR